MGLHAHFAITKVFARFFQFLLANTPILMFGKNRIKELNHIF